MISQNSTSAAAPLVDKLATAQLVARPLEGSVVESLCMLKPAFGLLESNDNGEAITDTCDCDTEEHKAAMDFMVKTVSDTVQATLHTAKNVVNPLIQQLVDTYEKYVQTTLVATTNNILIKPVFYHDLWTNPVVLSLCERFDGVPLTEVKLSVKFPTKSPEELRQLILTGNERFDKDLNDYLDGLNAQFGFDVLNDIYQVAFSFENLKALRSLDDLINPFMGNRNAALIILLLANRLLANIPDGMAVNLHQYRAYVTGVIEQAGRSVCRINQLVETDTKNKNMIITYPSIPFGNPFVESVIEVNGKVYNQWLSEGGQPEILFGAYATNLERSFTTLLENKDQYLGAWTREKKIIESKIRFEMRSVRSSALRKAFVETMNSLPEDQKRLPNAEMVKMSDDMIDHMDDKAYEYIYKYARKLICRSAFPGTDYEDFLKSIDAVASNNPGMDERECALLAAIEYVAGWVASQIKTVPY